jgi:hypothetical protein
MNQLSPSMFLMQEGSNFHNVTNAVGNINHSGGDIYIGKLPSKLWYDILLRISIL